MTVILLQYEPLLKCCREEGVVEMFRGCHQWLGCCFCCLATTRWWVHMQHWQVTQVNSLSRQHGQELSASSLTSGVQRCSFSVTCPGFHHLMVTSSDNPAVSSSRVQTCPFYLPVVSHFPWWSRQKHGLTLFHLFLHLLPALYPRRLLFNSSWFEVFLQAFMWLWRLLLVFIHSNY